MSNFEYECNYCGANEHSMPSHCCDECVVKFYLRNTKAPSIDQYSEWVWNQEEETE